MREATDGNGHFLMNITYSPDGRITSQTLKDGRIFRYEYLREPNRSRRANSIHRSAGLRNDFYVRRTTVYPILAIPKGRWTRPHAGAVIEMIRLA